MPYETRPTDREVTNCLTGITSQAYEVVDPTGRPMPGSWTRATAEQIAADCNAAAERHVAEYDEEEVE
jgi:hypothetical protein